MPVFNALTTQCIAYPTTAAVGRDHPHSPASEAIKATTDELKEFIGAKAKSNRRKSKGKSKALSDVIKVETTRFNAEIPVDLHRRVKLQAMDERRNMTDIVVDALTAYLKKHCLKQEDSEEVWFTHLLKRA